MGRIRNVKQSLCHECIVCIINEMSFAFTLKLVYEEDADVDRYAKRPRLNLRSRKYHLLPYVLSLSHFIGLLSIAFSLDALCSRHEVSYVIALFLPPHTIELALVAGLPFFNVSQCLPTPPSDTFAILVAHLHS